METVNVQIPPGMNEHEAEFYFDGDTIKVIHAGKLYSWADMPPIVKKWLKIELANDGPARQAFDQAGVDNLTDRLYVYAKCRFGGFNMTPDLSANGVKETTTEHWDCGCSGNCCLRPVFRDRFPAKYGILTTRQLNIIRLIAQGLQSKEIADQLCISIQTLDKEKQRIFHHTATTSALEIAKWAHKNLTL